MNYQLTSEEFELIRKYAFETEKPIEQTGDAFNISDEDLDRVLDQLDDAMTMYGLTQDQSEANELGLKLARLYDKLYSQVNE